MEDKLQNVEAILAVDANNGLAKNGKIPWKSKTDMEFFKNKTTNNIIIMGSKTLLSLPKSMPLKNRENIILTNNKEKYSNLYANIETPIKFLNLEEVLNCLKDFNNFDKKTIYIIGGNEIYNLLIPYCSTIWLTKLNKSYDCDLFFNYDLTNYNKTIVYNDSEINIIKLD